MGARFLFGTFEPPQSAQTLQIEIIFNPYSLTRCYLKRRNASYYPETVLH